MRPSRNLPLADLVKTTQSALRETSESGNAAPAPISRDFCPIAKTADIISGKWTLLIIRDLTRGVKRFHELEHSLKGISPKTLSERLRSLEEDGILRRQTFAEVPPRVEYSLTEKGFDLATLIENMRTFGNRWLC